MWKKELQSNLQDLASSLEKYSEGSSMIWGCLGASCHLLEGPSQGPDFSPIEMLWTNLLWTVHSRHPNNLVELKQFCKEEQAKITSDRCAGLIHSYRKCLIEVVAAHPDIKSNDSFTFCTSTMNSYRVCSINIWFFLFNDIKHCCDCLYVGRKPANSKRLPPFFLAPYTVCGNYSRLWQKNVLPVFSTHCYIYVCSQRAGGAAKDQPEGAGAGRQCGLGQDRRAVGGLLRSRHYQRVQVGHLCSSPSFKPLLMFTVVSIRSRCCKG